MIGWYVIKQTIGFGGGRDAICVVQPPSQSGSSALLLHFCPYLLHNRLFSQKGILVNQRLQQLSEEKIPESLTQINISKLHGYFCDLEQ